MYKENKKHPTQNTQQSHLIINVGHLPKGIYMLQITGERFNFTQKLLLAE